MSVRGTLHALAALVGRDSPSRSQPATEGRATESLTRADGDAKLGVLLTDYEATREEERNFLANQTALISVAITLLGIVGGLLTQVCTFAAPGAITPADAVTYQCTLVSPGVLAALPLAPFALLAYIAAVGTQATLRTFYVRALEREIRHRLPAHDRTMAAAYPGLRVTTLHELTTGQTTLSRGANPFRQMILLVVITLLALFGGTTLYIALSLPPFWTASMLLVYGVGGAFLVRTMWQSTVGGPRMFERAVAVLEQRLSRALGTRSPRADQNGERSLASYLLFPRPADVVKLPFVPLAFALAATATGTGLWRDRLPAVLLVWLALELLLYQARYQWNDVRDLAADRDEPQRSTRGRLPLAGGVRAAVTASLGAAVVRLLTVAVLTLAPVPGAGIDPGRTLWLLMAAVFGLAVVYETLRGLDVPQRWHGLVAWSIYLLVGGGYVIRGLTGLRLGDVEGQLPPVTYLTLGAFLATYGSTFVMLTWTLHAASYCLEPPAPAGAAVPYSAALDRKPHLRRLLRHAGVRLGAARPGVPDDDVTTAGARSTLLLRRGRVPTAWNTFTIAAGPAAGAAALGLLDPAAPGATWAAASAVTGAVGVLLVLAGRHRGRVAVTVIGSVATPLVLQRLGLVHDIWDGVIATVPVLTLAVTVVVFRKATYAELQAFGKNLRNSMETAGTLVLRAVLGRTTASRVTET